MEGWIKLHRKILNWEWYRDDNVFKVFIYLLLSANHEDNKWKGISLKRGQLVAGRNSISANTGISVQSVRTCLNRLKSTSEITIKPTNKYSIITITKYEDYQFSDKQINQQNNQEANLQSTSNQPATNHKQEYKKDKNDNNTSLKENLIKEKITLSKVKKNKNTDLSFLDKYNGDEKVPEDF